MGKKRKEKKREIKSFRVVIYIKGKKNIIQRMIKIRLRIVEEI